MANFENMGELLNWELSRNFDEEIDRVVENNLRIEKKDSAEENLARAFFGENFWYNPEEFSFVKAAKVIFEQLKSVQEMTWSMVAMLSAAENCYLGSSYVEMIVGFSESFGYGQEQQSLYTLPSWENDFAPVLKERMGKLSLEGEYQEIINSWLSELN